MRSLRAPVTLAAWLLLATTAHATPLFIAGNDMGVTNTATQYWDAIQGSPNLASTTADATTGNTHSIEISAAASTAEYVAQTVSSATTLVASMRLRIPTATSVPTTRRKILSFRDTGGSQDGCMITAEADPIETSKFRLRAFFESADTTGGECSASDTQDGKECTNASECDYVNAGEQSCAPGVYAATGRLDKGTWYLVTLKQVNGAGEVTCTLWQGTAGASPASYQRGSQTRLQGICSGGDFAGNACNELADCSAGGGTCDTSDIASVEQVRFGTDDTTAGAFTYNIDDMVIDSADAQPNYRIHTLVPESPDGTREWGVTGCTSNVDEYACIDDATPDDDSTYASSAADGEIQQAAVGNITLAGGESVLAVTSVALVRSQGGSSPMYYGMDSTSRSAYDPDTVGTTYHLTPPYLVTDPTGAPTSWTDTLVNALQFYAEIGVGGGTVRMTQARLEVLIDQADPPVPTIIPDVNSDGEDTVCLVGDSTYNDSGFHDIVVGGLLEPTNVLDCSRGGATPGDVTENISIAGTNNDILDGASSQFMGCRALKGTTLKACDVVVMQIGVNALLCSPTADPANRSPEHGLSLPGYCDNKGGSNDGGACFCPHGTDHRQSDPSSDEAKRYCRTKGADWLTECELSADCACSSDAHCCSDCTDASCATCANTTGTCTGSVCACLAPFGCVGCNADQQGAYWSASCVSGCLDSPQCPGGLCMAHESVGDVMSEIRQINTAKAARSVPPIIVYSAPPPGSIKNEIGCWQDIERNVGNLRTNLLAFARTNSLPYLDMYGRFLQHCPGGQISGTACRTNGCTYDGSDCTYSEGCCLRDAIHWNDLGQAVAADTIIACLTNAGSVTHDGACNEGVTDLCTAGRINDPCTSDAECDTWSCSL